MPVPRQPVVFVSHGAPDTLIKAPQTVAAWTAIGHALPAPTAILALSAHWEARLPTASLADMPETLHDFSGFAPALDRLRYPAPGAPQLAERSVRRLADAGIAADLHPTRGLDHGAWVPLLAMRPDAAVPVTQLALPHGAGPATLAAIGRALAPLRDEGVLILASGAITHNFAWIDWSAGAESAPDPRASAFADWIGAQLAQAEPLDDWRRAPHGPGAHPTDEHLAPLLIAMAAAGAAVPQRVQPPYAYRGLNMDAYVWGLGM